MDDVNYFKDLFDSIAENRKIVLLLFLAKDEMEFLSGIGLIERDINSLILEF